MAGRFGGAGGEGTLGGHARGSLMLCGDSWVPQGEWTCASTDAVTLGIMNGPERASLLQAPGKPPTVQDCC